MEYNIGEIAERISGLRNMLGLSIEEMADATDETIEGYLSYETGTRDFSFGFLYHCADKFGVDIVELLTGESPHLSGYTVVRQGKGLPIKRREGFEYYHLASRFKNKLSEPFLVKAPYVEELQSLPIELNTHEGHEFDYILSGRLRFVCRGHIEELNPGDAVYYNSESPHGMIATGGEDCTFLAVLMKKPEEALKDEKHK